MDIKAKIKKQGFTISEVAAKMTTTDAEGKPKVGISQSALSQMITGNPTLQRLQEIASIIGVSISELVSDGDFTAFVRNGGELRAFDSAESLKEYVDELCGEAKRPIHANIRGKEYYQQSIK